MNRKTVLGILVTQILFTGLIGMLNTPTLAETIPITEVFYGDGRQVFEQGIYIIATETDPVEMYPNYTNKKAYYEMLKEHVTTETSVGVFISILVSQGICSSSGYGVGIESIEKIDNEFVISANLTEPGPGCIVFFIINNPVALIPIGSLPVGEYSITLQVDQYVFHCPSWWHEYIGTETWTATFSCSEWITVTSSAVEMSIENKTTPLGEELSILMVAPMGAVWLPSTQVFDVYLYDCNYSLFSYWSQDKGFWDVMTSVPPGYEETLRWNLYHYDPSTGEFTPPPPGNYYLIGAIMPSASGPADFTPPILIRIEESTITPGIHATPDLTIEGVVMPYMGFIIYPIPEPDPFFYLINVTVTNQGTSDAGRFNVSFTVHLEGEIMPEYGRKKTVEGLQQGANEILLFEWDPQDYGNYTLTIAADSDNDIVELDETNNVRITWVIGTIGGDMDGDGYVGSADAGILNGSYGTSYPFPPYPPADIDWDGYIGSADAGILNGAYGTSI